MPHEERAMIDEPTEQKTTTRGERETGRLEAFSDGVFAVAITLLILSIPVPDKPNDLLGQVLAKKWAFLAYLISFLTILIMWINHHSLFKQVARVDRPFLLLNGLLLMLVTFVNYPTALMVEYLATSEAKTAALIYTGTFVVIAMLFSLLWFAAAHKRRLLAADAEARVVAAISRAYRYGPLYYVAAFALALVSVPASLLLSLLLAIYFAIYGREAL
jgi:uncharacterized membrane protein